MPREGHALTEKEVIRHCLARLESFMAPWHVAIVEALPKTDTGKIKKPGSPEGAKAPGTRPWTARRSSACKT